jgi:signal transduction histidine kinase
MSQDGLLNGSDSLRLSGKNSAAIIALFEKVNSPFNEIDKSASGIIASLQQNLTAHEDSLSKKNILANEPFFLSGMESIVFQYANEAEEKVATLSKLEYLLLVISLLAISLEIIFIFRPTAQQVNDTLDKLLNSEKTAKKLTKEVMALYSSLEKSYEQISNINQPIDNPTLLAKGDKGGTVVFISSYFSELTNKELTTEQLTLGDLFDGIDNSTDWMDEVIDTVTEDRFWQGEIAFKDSKGKDCWIELTILPTYDASGEVTELLMLGADLTLRKMAEQNLNQKTRAEIEKKINQQKYRSVLILEGQEEERKRIAMDIHDGIGQMLTSLKFQIESIDLSQVEEAMGKLVELRQLTKELIKEVRKVTFNLKPTVLGDYGLEAALKVFTKEIGKLIDIKLTFKTEEIPRLPQKVENNIFRIIQEAINNAIKYSEAEVIEINLQQNEQELIILVKDEGKGFNEKLVESRSANIESGRGFFNMYERTEYINGNLEINSLPGKGTSVTLTVPLHSEVVVE